MRIERVAIVTAMVQEMRPLIRRLQLRRHDLGGVAAYRGRDDGRHVVAAVTGMGTAAARAATETLLDAQPIDRVLVVGIAGAVAPHLEIGSLVNPGVVVDAGTGMEYRPTSTGSGASRGAILTTDELIVDPHRLEELLRRGIVAVDMETAAVAEVCSRRGVSWSVVRAISDRVGDPRTDASVVGLARPDGSADLPAVLRYLRRHPGRVAHLARLGRGAHAATQTAADAAMRSLRG